MDKYGKDKFFYPVAVLGVLGGILVYVIKFTNCNPVWRYVLFILGGTMIEGASLLAAALFNATARDYTPEEKAGCFQGIRIIIFVMLPMIIGSIVNPLVIKGFGPVIEKFGEAPANGYIILQEMIDKNTGAAIGYVKGDSVYPFEMFLFSSLAAAFVFIPAVIVKKENKKFRAEKLLQLNVETVTAGNNVDVSENAYELEQNAAAEETAEAIESAEQSSASDSSDEK